MPLTISPQKFADRFTNNKSDTHFLVLTSMVIGIPEITKRNVVEVYCRNKFLNPQFPYTIEDIKNHIGMKTNVTPETRVRWLTRIAKNKFHEIEYAMEEEISMKPPTEIK
tara:strand:+ start:564 stop:893 length:330 start_codon:yes stop_codon:yes gene_type:complete